MTEIKGYHAQVYYGADTRKIAEDLRETIILALEQHLATHRC
jgi:aromatic ring-cleaving dioxygenase